MKQTLSQVERQIIIHHDMAQIIETYNHSIAEVTLPPSIKFDTVTITTTGTTSLLSFTITQQEGSVYQGNKMIATGTVSYDADTITIRNQSGIHIIKNYDFVLITVDRNFIVKSHEDIKTLSYITDEISWAPSGIIKIPEPTTDITVPLKLKAIITNNGHPVDGAITLIDDNITDIDHETKPKEYPIGSFILDYKVAVELDNVIVSLKKINIHETVSGKTISVYRTNNSISSFFPVGVYTTGDRYVGSLQKDKTNLPIVGTSNLVCITAITKRNNVTQIKTTVKNDRDTEESLVIRHRVDSNNFSTTCLNYTRDGNFIEWLFVIPPKSSDNMFKCDITT